MKKIKYLPITILLGEEKNEKMTKSIDPRLNYCQGPDEMVVDASSSLTSEWLDSRQAAQFLKVSVPMLRNMTSNGQVPFYKLGRRNRYRVDELEALLLKGRRGPL